ncbi:MAG: class I SAM-dependent methyltransferase [Isosphaeraceae bacterium]|nr:class I SAM-dependent methyltransferase [Isosphaeraceae bacterium]
MSRMAGNVDAEEYVLTTAPGHALLAEVAAVAEPRPADVAQWRRGRSAEIVAAAMRIAESRRRGRSKFSRAGEMWFDAVGLEQATSEVVANHKAERFRNALVVDLCCGIGGDSRALAGVGHVLSIDVDEGMVRRTRWNAGVYGVAERLAPFRSSAEEFPIPPDAYVHIDPDRRARGRFRAKSIVDYAPSLDFLLALPSKVKAGAIKLGPAGDFDLHFDSPAYELEVVSLSGECKEATLWFGRVANARRRATVLPAGATISDRDLPESSLRAEVSELGAWVLEPDPALIRAGLLDGFARAHAARRFAEGVDLLTSDQPIDSPFLVAFQVEESIPLDLKRLRRIIDDKGLSQLEIKTRGVDLAPDDLRRRLKTQGGRSGTLILVGGGGRSIAIIARRVRDQANP